jgi:hypothetical protein
MIHNDLIHACVMSFALVAAWSPNTALASDKVNYSGKYSLQGRKTASGSQSDLTLNVVQNEDSIEVSRVEHGRRTTSRCPFNGSEGEYTSPGGVPGKCRAQLKGKYLVLHSVVVTRPQPTGPPVRVHTRERWQLSADSRTLTIRTDVDFPSSPVGASAALDISGTDKYKRTDNP